MKIGIYVPSIDSRVYSQFAMQQIPNEVAALGRDGHQYMGLHASTCDLVQMRNEALELARQYELDYLCMQDADIYGPTGAPLAKLVELAHEKGAAMTAAVCGLRRPEIDRVQCNVKPFHPGETYEAEEVGTGMVCISIAEIERIAKEFDGPWFTRTYKDSRHSDPAVGLDIYFSRLLRAHGGTIWVDGNLETVHVCNDHEKLRFLGAMTDVVEDL